MKYLFIPLAIFLTLTLTNCTKTYYSATVIRDCSGTYIRKNSNDYLVCNPDMLSDYKNNDAISVQFKNTDCELDGFHCELYHPHKGTVKITDVK